MNGIELLNEFRERRSDAAFCELVRRYTNLVYSAAYRRLGSQSLARDATQMVFIRLAKDAPRRATEAELSAWLHRTTVHVSIDLWRSETRRRLREQHAAAMQPAAIDAPSWNDLAPALDEALNELNDADRQAILLRFFESRSMRELGAALGVSEDAAKMRVSRALERLRGRLAVRGLAGSAAALAALLAERSIEAAPAEVASALAAVDYSGALAAGASAGLLVKMAVGTAVVTAAGAIAWLAWRSSAGSSPTGPQQFFLAAATGTARANSPAPPPAALDSPRPAAAPGTLWQAAIRARMRLNSGQFAWEIVTTSEFSTNRLQVSAVFEGSKRRFEQTGREYSYTYDPDPARAEEIRNKANAYGGDREAAIAAGLLSGFESRYVTVFDGDSITRYCEKDGQPVSTTIDNPNKGSSSFVFDPRALGLFRSLSPMTSIEDPAGWSDPMAWLGMEPVDGVIAHHLRRSEPSTLDIWLDAAQPARVVRVQAGASVVTSRYDQQSAANPIPCEVIYTELRNGAPVSETRIIQKSATPNIPVEPATFTLAGLGMKIGTSVSDIRISRRIGYWTGAGLSENLPATAAESTNEAPLQDRLDILNSSHPASPAAKEAAEWILTNTPDGTAVQQAAELILQEHVRSPDLARLCQELGRLRPRCATAILEAVLKENTAADVQAAAALSLGALLKDQSGFGANKGVAAEAEQLFLRAIERLDQLGPTAATRVAEARRELIDLQRFSIGQPAPALDGVDLRGRPFSLTALRGRVTILMFWSGASEDAHESVRALEPLRERGIVWVGVNCDRDQAKALAAAEQFNTSWPMLWDGRSGPMASAWNIHSWPSIFVLDGAGVIRARNLRGRALAEAAGKLAAP